MDTLAHDSQADRQFGPARRVTILGAHLSREAVQTHTGT